MAQFLPPPPLLMAWPLVEDFFPFDYRIFCAGSLDLPAKKSPEKRDPATKFILDNYPVSPVSSKLKNGSNKTCIFSGHFAKAQNIIL